MSIHLGLLIKLLLMAVGALSLQAVFTSFFAGTATEASNSTAILLESSTAVITREIIQQRKQETSCRIATYSTDGIGHQLEAKLSCILATGLHQHELDYVHIPIDQVEHGVDASVADILDFTTYTTISENHMRKEHRTISDIYWLSTKFQFVNCSEEPRETVHIVDNCFDSFYPNLNSNMTFTNNVIEEAQPLMIEKIISKQSLHEFFTNLTVVAHIRRGDTVVQWKDRLSNKHYHLLFQSLQQAAAGRPINFIVHTNDMDLQVEDFVGIQSIEVFRKETSVSVVLRDMLKCDIFIMSSSSLSNAMGLLRSSGRPNLHPVEAGRRSNLLGLGWTFIRITNKQKFNFVTQETANITPTPDFYQHILDQALAFRANKL